MANNRCVECGCYVSAGYVRCERCMEGPVLYLIPVQPEWNAEQVQTKIAEYKAQIQRWIECGEPLPEGCRLITDVPYADETFFIPDEPPPSLWARFCGWLRRAWWWLVNGRDI